MSSIDCIGPILFCLNLDLLTWCSLVSLLLVLVAPFWPSLSGTAVDLATGVNENKADVVVMLGIDDVVIDIRFESTVLGSVDVVKRNLDLSTGCLCLLLFVCTGATLLLFLSSSTTSSLILKKWKWQTKLNTLVLVLSLSLISDQWTLPQCYFKKGIFQFLDLVVS